MWIFSFFQAIFRNSLKWEFLLDWDWNDTSWNWNDLTATDIT